VLYADLMDSRLCASAVQELLADTLRKQCADETTTVGRVFADEAKRLVSQQFGTNQSAKPLKISFTLTADQQNLLKKNFPGRNIVFDNSSSSSHCFAAAHRLLETDFVYNCFGNDHSTIIDLGGNYVSHLKQRRYNVHCCCPLLDGRDCARHTERLMSLATYKHRHPEEVNDVNFCSDTFQDCNMVADFAFAIHSTSDLGLADLCDALERKGVKKFICTIMVVPEMLISTKGFIEHFNVNWYVDKKADRIFFDFVEAPCLGYDHKYSVLMQYMQISAVQVGDAAFRVERKQDFGGVMVVDITRCAGFKPGISLNCGRACAWFTSLVNKTIVHCTDVDVEHPMFDVISKRKVLIDTKVLTRVCEASFRQFKPQVDACSAIQSISTMLSSSTNHCIINGVTMLAGTPVKIEDYVPIATTIYYRVRKIYTSINTALANMAVEVEPERRQPDFNTPYNLFVAYTNSVQDHLPRGHNFVNTEREVMASDIIFAPVRRLLKSLGYAPSKVIRSEGGTDFTGNGDAGETIYCYESFEKNLKSLSGFITGHYEQESPLLSDPRLFVPMEMVLRSANPQYGSVITVKGMKESLSKEFERKAKEKITADLKREAERKKLEKAILQVAAWTAAHPDGKIPGGLGDKVLYPTEISSVDAHLNESVINPHAEVISEAINYLKSTSAVSRSKLEGLGNHCQWRQYGISTVWAGDESRRIFLPRSGRWLGPPTVRNVGPKAQYERGMSKDGYVIMHWDKDEGKVSEECRRSLLNFEIVLFDDSCKFSSAERIIPSLEKALRMDCDFKVTIMDGVAGCGKTTQIKSMANLSADGPDLILTSNRSSADELKASLDMSAAIKPRYIRTCDSFLMTNNPPTSNRILFDECFMQHAGCIYAAATLAKCSEVIAYGDTEQIPFISRNDTILLRHHKLSGEIVKQTLTYRCPLDATAALSKFFYKKKWNLKSKRAVVRSIRVIPINSVNQIEVDASALYITHTQAEKIGLKSTPQFKNMNIMTSHEAQGGTYDRVIFVRISRTSSNLTAGNHPIMGPCHSLVALSRHKVSFKYYTTAHSDSDDILLKACNYASRLSDDDIGKFLSTDI